MINQLEIPMFIEDALPGMQHELIVNGKSDAYGTINQLARYTDQQIKEHNFNTVKKCFAVADKLYYKGNSVVKNAIQNVFVFSVTRMFQNCPAEKARLQGMMPVGLFTLYMGQVYHSGC